MCGIAGWFAQAGQGASDATERVEKMCGQMKDRGPDDSGQLLLANGRGAFGHTRLKVIDLSENGAQPMTSHDGRYRMTYNGEIYNHKSIRKKLEKEGHISQWRGTSDTETLLEAIAAYGIEQALKECKGMFALAVYDEKTGELSLARDRIGEKPLYFGFTGDAFVFASDLKAIDVLKEFNGELRLSVLRDYFIYGYIPTPYSIYRDVWKMMPGTILTVEPPYDTFDPVADGAMPFYSAKSGQVQQKKGYRVTGYYSVAEVALAGAKNPFAGSYEEACDTLEDLLKRSVRAQAVADVPVGAFLSAGIDSSTIVSLLQATATHAGNTRTFTIAFEDKDFDESDAAMEIASHLHTTHTKLPVTEKDAKEVIPLLTGMYGEPFADSSQIPTYLVSKLTRENVTVALTGDGGDELFAGYNSYFSVDRIWGKLKKMPRGARVAAAELMSVLTSSERVKTDKVTLDKIDLMYATGPHDVQHIQQTQLDDKVEALYDSLIGLSLENEDLFPEDEDFDLDDMVSEGENLADLLPQDVLKDTIRQMMLLDFYGYHPDDILTKVDRAAMAVSLETRIPFLDPDVMAFAWSLPTEFLTKNGQGKRIVRDILKRHVPEELFAGKPKKGFSVPVKRWLKEGALRDWAEEMLAEPKLKRESMLDAKIIRGMWDEYIEEDIWRPQIWYALMFEQWLEG